MLVRISDPTYLLALRGHLAERADCIATAVGPDTLDVTILGSYNVDAMDLETQLRIRAWEEAQRTQGVDVHCAW